MNVSLEGKIALVTGGGQGVGRAIALRLAESGAAGVCIVVLDAAQGPLVCEELRAAGGCGTRASFVVADLARDEAVEQVMTHCLQQFGRIDCLANAAARSDRAALADVDAATWDLMFRTNTRAPAFLMQRCIADMRARDSGGAIVNIVSMLIHAGMRNLGVYAATKAALALLTRDTAHAHRFDRIRVNAIAMGWTDTPGERHMQANILGHGPGWLAQAEAAQPSGRLLQADDVARLATFLLSDCSLPMTGAVIDQEQWVNGGRD